ncbi:hypothetical protein [Shimia ponticola]|uniref:hypothetical protein n=1 Tax=Shimia ponticola TaxID=2582893 RepID=UPI0011BDDB21|nr:hypothetical protein [Shimia ponticola]
MDNTKWGYRLPSRFGHNGLAALGRLLQGVFAKALVFAALALWLMPGSSFDMDLIAMKGGVTVGLLMLAIACYRNSKARPPEVHVDLIRKEVRVVERSGRKSLLKKFYRFSDLGAMYVRDHALHLHAPEGEILAVLKLDPDVETQLG